MNIEYTYMFIAIAILFFALYKFGVFKALVNLIDERNAKVVSDVTEAENLRKEAEKLYDKAFKDLEEAKQTSKDIISNAELHAQNYSKEQGQRLEDELDRKIKLAEERIALSEKTVSNEISQKAVDAAILAVEDMIKTKLTKNQYDDILDQSLIKVKSTKLH